MDTEHMIAFLINGSLIKILDAGTASRSTAFVTRDDHSPSGFRTIYHPTGEDNTSPLGEQVTPLDATDGGSIVENKKEEVEDYLIESFGLTGIQARRVVNEAHLMTLAA
jgi:hypothetical protein